jgi:hypothetical protein
LLREHLLIFDDLVVGASSVFTHVGHLQRFGRYDQFAAHAVVKNPTGVDNPKNPTGVDCCNPKNPTGVDC